MNCLYLSPIPWEPAYLPASASPCPTFSSLLNYKFFE